ncbi:HutD family protein [Streptomyces sp. NPDC058045]|uniref:HutD/Ves family protein n=1 Tax=Streptomyces sp. NPDC058045 TaxID=3346311 RepID=UPI0036E4DA36
MTPRILPAAGRRPVPWKNGGGVTTQVAAAPEGAGTEDFAWRVSVAEVAHGGPFSAFEGVDRIITLVDGPGMVLTVDGVRQVVDAPGEPFAFSGDAATDCELLGGPVVDFNVMVRRGQVSAEVRVARGPTEVRAAAGSRVLAVVLSGTAAPERTGARLGRLDAVLLEAGEAESFAVTGALAVVTFSNSAVPGAS